MMITFSCRYDRDDDCPFALCLGSWLAALVIVILVTAIISSRLPEQYFLNILGLSLGRYEILGLIGLITFVIIIIFSELIIRMAHCRHCR